MSKIVANLIVSSDSSDAGDNIVMELDGDLNIDSSGDTGNTSFSPGDTIYFRVQNSGSLSISEILSTHGSVYEYVSGTSRSITESYLWETEDTENELSYLPSGSLEITSYGNAATIKKSGNFKLITDLSGADTLPAYTSIKYTSSFDVYKLIAPSVELKNDESYTVVIVLYAE